MERHLQKKKLTNSREKPKHIPTTSKLSSNEIHVARSHVINIMQYKTQGTIFRSKVRWHEHGEGNTRYLYSLEQPSFEKNRQPLN